MPWPPERARINTGNGPASEIHLEAIIKMLAKRYEIEAKDLPELEAMLRDIIKLYEDWVPKQRLASKQEIKTLLRALGTAKNYLDTADVQERLLEASGEAGAIDKDQIASLIDQAAKSLGGLRHIAKAAKAMDGRTMSSTARNNAIARKAGQKLVDYWVKSLRRPRSFQNRGSVRGLEFVLDCIHEFDPSVKASTIRSLSPFKRGPRGKEIYYNSVS
jgi:hypothetical protein